MSNIDIEEMYIYLLERNLIQQSITKVYRIAQLPN